MVGAERQDRPERVRSWRGRRCAARGARMERSYSPRSLSRAEARMSWVAYACMRITVWLAALLSLSSQEREGRGGMVVDARQIVLVLLTISININAADQTAPKGVGPSFSANHIL